MKLSFCGNPLEDGYSFNDADTGQPDTDNSQETEPVRLLGGPSPLSNSYRSKLIDRFFNTSLPTSKSTMLREVGIAEDDINALTRNPEDRGKAWDAEVRVGTINNTYGKVCQ